MPERLPALHALVSSEDPIEHRKGFQRLDARPLRLEFGGKLLGALLLARESLLLLLRDGARPGHLREEVRAVGL